MEAITWSTEAILALGYVSVFAGVLAYLAYFALLDETGAIQANLIFYVVPVVSTLGGWALLGEQIAPLAVVGFLTIFAGFAVLGSESIDVRSRLPAPPALWTENIRSGRDGHRAENRSSVTDEPKWQRSD